MTLATESGHFYLPDGSPFYEVENKSRGGMRPATLRDAKKVGAEPSVSTVLRAAASPALERWKVEQALDAALTLPRMEGESLDDFKARARKDSQEQGKKAAERGTELHTAIERHIQCKPFDEQFQPHVNNTISALQDKGISIMEGKPERSFCLPGMYGGKVDLHGDGWVLDFKGIDDAKLGGKMGYPNHIQQLAAYGYGLGLKNPRCLNVFIGRAEGGVQVKEWTPEERDLALEQFLALLKFYRLSNGLDLAVAA